MLKITSFFDQFTCFIITVFTLTLPGISIGQELLHSVRTEIENRGVDIAFTELYKLNEKVYFREPAAGTYRIKFGNEFYQGNRDDTLIDFQRRDQFVFKLNTNLEVEDYYVIDNCDDFDDHTSTDTYSVMLVNMNPTEDADSLAIMTLPEGIEFKRSDYLGKSILLVTDHEFNYNRHLIPTSGKITHILGGVENLFMVIEIPQGEPYILVGADTVYNHFNPDSDPLLSFVVASYNLQADAFNWWGRCGSPWDDRVFDVKLDGKENIIILVKHFGNFDIMGVDTVSEGTGPDYNLIFKVDKDGDYLWSEVFEGSTSEYFTSFGIDEADNIYMLGSIIGNVTFFDTTISTTDNTTHDSQSVILKLDADGLFKWVSHLPGDYEVTSFLDILLGFKEDDFYVSGTLRNGTLNLSSGDIVDDSSYPTTYIIRFRKDNGQDAGHISIMQGIGSTFLQVHKCGQNDLLTYLLMRDEVSFLGQVLTSLQNRFSNFLLKISTPWDSVVAVRDLYPGELRVFPNPVFSDQTVTINLVESDPSEGMEFSLVDQQGFKVRTIRANEGNIFSFSTKGIIPGCYNLVGFSKEYYWTYKIIVQ